MSSDGPDPSQQVGELDQVGEWMQACLAESAERRALELERLCAAHPAQAAELRRRFAFLREAGLDESSAPDALLHATFGDFQIQARLAAGGMGVVYRARQLSLGREVALKLVRPELLLFDGARERFRREAATVAGLSHPGIVPVYTAGEERGVPYLAMQLVEGCTLAEALSAVSGRAPESLSGADLIAAARARAGASGPLPEGFESDWVRAIAGVAQAAARGLAHAHARGVAHRDVKPSNVLLSVDGRAQLIDFGLTASEATDSLTRSGSRIGTLHYMAPERLRGERGVDVRSDIYSLGVTLYELLALQAPFQADTRADLERLVLDGRVDSLRVRNRRVDADLERICLQALAPEPERRYADAQALADDLGRWLAGEPVRARVPGALERARRWVRRHKAAAAALALAFVLVAGVPTGLYLLQRRHAGELARSFDAERAALSDMRVANEIVTRVLRDASPAYGDGHQVTLYESLEKMAQLAEQGQDSPRARAQVLAMLGQIYHSRSDFDRADSLLARADELLRSSGFGVGKERALVLEKLGLVQKERGNLEAAREHYRSAAQVALEAGLVAGGWTARMLALEAATYFKTDRAHAAELLREALRTFEPARGDADDRDWLRTNRLRMAQLEGSLGHAAAGLALLGQVRADIAALGAPSLRERLELAAAESQLAIAARDFTRAERVLREALELSRETLGQQSSTTATLLFQLGSVCFELGAREEARSRMDESLEIRRQLAGPDSAATKQLIAEIARYFPGEVAK